MCQVNVIAAAFVKLVGGGGDVDVAAKQTLSAAYVALELRYEYDTTTFRVTRYQLSVPGTEYAVRVQQVVLVALL